MVLRPPAEYLLAVAIVRGGGAAQGRIVRAQPQDAVGQRRLVSEISGARDKITETYTVDREQHRLTITVQVDNSRMPNGVVTRRVYDAQAGR